MNAMAGRRPHRLVRFSVTISGEQARWLARHPILNVSALLRQTVAGRIAEWDRGVYAPRHRTRAPLDGGGVRLNTTLDRPGYDWLRAHPKINASELLRAAIDRLRVGEGLEPELSAPASTGADRGGAAAPPSRTWVPLEALAPGEVLVLSIGEGHVETATNVHGKVVIERLARPR
ncbi:MAG: hypothetical protein KGJ23_13965 [Euryarchaeota archaeon]|nr:hypothetical protein [Euryarchaeota archaeon]MDE1837704.1 hypothetical protein [Euryarchaeota archaeon]MDE1881737.1 hypothetical protein [Euryarchaeota archaeon]MDE2045966.1 hypothetical protein [Thermoplasmata archaeon]